MIYWLLKPFVYISLNVYYRLGIRGLDKIPYDKPLVFAPNHVNGFVDPVILGVFLKQKVRFFARGDAFKGKFAKWILNQMNVSPMYRIQEGYAEIKKNDKSFEECRELLSQDKNILIFPEALCVQERRLRPLKKGLGRIVFQTEESIDFSKDIYIIPVGLNYEAATRFRSRAFIDIGEPVSVKEYEKRYKEDKVRAINEFTKMFEDKLSAQMLIIKDPANDSLVAGIEEIYMRQWLKDKKVKTKRLVDQYTASREIAEMVNVLTEERPELIFSLRDKMASYLTVLHKNKLRDHLLDEESINKTNIGTFIVEYLFIYLGMPFYLLGLLMNYPPYYMAASYADKNIKKAEFYPSIRVNFSMILWTFYYLLQLIVVGIVSNSWLITALYGVVAALLGVFVLWFYPRMKKIFGRWTLLRMVRKEKDALMNLLNERAGVMQELKKAQAEYAIIKNK